MTDEPQWDVIGYDEPLTDEDIEHLKAGTVAVRMVSEAEMLEMYGTTSPLVRLTNLTPE